MAMETIVILPSWDDVAGDRSTPIVYAVPIQLLAYHTAVFMGTDVDQPRNLAKSVTVEMPLVRTVYKSTKQIFETVLKEQGNSFKKVGLIEFPRAGTWALVFISTDAKGEIAAKLNQSGEEMVAVFLAPTPVPTAGFLMFVPRSKLMLLDMSPEEGVKLLISAGLVTPDYKPTIADAMAAFGTSRPTSLSNHPNVPVVLNATAFSPHAGSGSPRRGGADKAACAPPDPARW
jgi:uncharacterized membrane protein